MEHTEDENTSPETSTETEDEKGRYRWHAAALCMGYNELAKQGKTLGEKLYFRLACQMAEKNFVKLGGNLFINRDEPPILELPDHMPWIRFTLKDIELMREAVAAYDAGAITPSEGKR